MSFELVAPATVAEALSALRGAEGGAVAALAGGTDLLRDIDDGRLAPRRVLSLRSLPWRTLTHHGPSLTIGSTLPLRRLELDPGVRAGFPGLWEAIRAVGSVALRHRATVGGNLGRASPASDLTPILLAHDATVRLVGPGGTRALDLRAFILGPRRTALGAGELIESLTVPEAAPSTYVWQRVRPANDISQVGVAAVRSATAPHWRLALGGVWPAPVRLPEVERALHELEPSESDIAAAARSASEQAPFVTDKRASEAYRRRLVGVLVARALRATVAIGRRPR